MSEWWTYRPEDFLLFSPRVYWRMFELQNAALWPLPLAALGVGALMLVLVATQARRDALWSGAVLGILWAFVAWSFFWSRYAGINWAAPYVASAFALEAALLFGAALTRGLRFDRRGPAAWAGWLLAAFAIALYPLLAPLAGRPLAASEIFGIAPDPTAIGTLGLLLLARGPALPLLLPVPVLWCALTALTLRTMGEPQAWVPIAALALAGAAALATILARRRAR
ncbi:DUF6064 family protein [Faunimonas sp. B44]|uniref:DUF6064 family protein n=1 Tax=Faunimonas sp. B44 TaxID=3461493 RepID=UPI0040439528